MRAVETSVVQRRRVHWVHRRFKGFMHSFFYIFSGGNIITLFFWDISQHELNVIPHLSQSNHNLKNYAVSDLARSDVILFTVELRLPKSYDTTWLFQPHETISDAPLSQVVIYYWAIVSPEIQTHSGSFQSFAFQQKYRFPQVPQVSTPLSKSIYSLSMKNINV